ncbi:hypothetical protein TNCV_3178221 [Trichonephila clavipes]|nr:hypothetical protein TNCV_3178221 [Trichonephila clavipes]
MEVCASIHCDAYRDHQAFATVMVDFSDIGDLIVRFRTYDDLAKFQIASATSRPVTSSDCYDTTEGAAETSRSITTRVIERDVNGEIHYFLEESRWFRTRQHNAKMVANITKLAANLLAKNDANLALPPIFRQVLIESPL